MNPLSTYLSTYILFISLVIFLSRLFNLYLLLLNYFFLSFLRSAWNKSHLMKDIWL